MKKEAIFCIVWTLAAVLSAVLAEEDRERNDYTLAAARAAICLVCGVRAGSIGLR